MIAYAPNVSKFAEGSRPATNSRRYRRPVPLFKRGRAQPSSTPDDVGTLLLQGHDTIARTARAHSDRWGLGTAERWGLDQATGTLS